MIGILRTVGLRIAGGIFDAWLSPLVVSSFVAVLAIGLGLAAVRLWPANNDTARRVADAIEQRETIEAESRAQEGVDNAWIEKYQQLQRETREAANRANREASSRVVFGADDEWLRRKRAAAR